MSCSYGAAISLASTPVGPPPLTATQQAVLMALTEAQGRPLGRRELARRAGLKGTSLRRCDAVVGELRRVLGPDAIVTVRRRGWAAASYRDW